MKPKFTNGDIVEVNAPGMKAGTVGRVIRQSWRCGSDRNFYIVSVWIASSDELIEVSEKHLKRIEPKRSESDLNAKRWRK